MVNYNTPARSEKKNQSNRDEWRAIASTRVHGLADFFSNVGRVCSKGYAENGWQEKVTEKYKNLSQLSNGHNFTFSKAFLAL